MYDEGGRAVLSESLDYEEDWERHIAYILKQALQQHDVSYEWLAAEITVRSDMPVTVLKLKKQLSTGKISARLLLQIIDSLGDKKLSLKDFDSMDRREKGKTE